MITYRKLNRYKYQLVEGFEFQTSLIGKEMFSLHKWVILKKDGLLTFMKGYCWDGPSGPTFDTKNFMRGSLVHDGLYQLLSEHNMPKKEREAFRKDADMILWSLCKEDGMSSIRAWWVYWGVRIFGRPLAFWKRQSDITVAP